MRIDGESGGVGAGFLFGAPRHVATARHVVANGGMLTITLADGRKRKARTIAADEANDLAVLELDEPVDDVAPLAPSTLPLVVGENLVAIGHPLGPMGDDGGYKGLFSWSASIGIVSTFNEKYVQTDAAVNHGNSGGPLLDCNGNVVAVVSTSFASGLSFGIAVKHLVRLEAEAVRAPTDASVHTVGIQLRLGGAFEHDDRNWYGVHVAASLIARGRAHTTLRYGVLWLDGSQQSPIITESGRRHRIDLLESFVLPLRESRPSIALDLGLGASLYFEDTRRITGGVAAGTFFTTSEEHSDGHLRGIAEAGAWISAWRLSYAALVSPRHEAVTHRFAIELRL